MEKIVYIYTILGRWFLTRRSGAGAASELCWSDVGVVRVRHVSGVGVMSECYGAVRLMAAVS